MRKGPGRGPAQGWAGRNRARLYTAAFAATALGVGATVGITVAGASPAARDAFPVAGGTWQAPAGSYVVSARTSTPIKHVVVLFDENVSFDHYFGTYPKAANTDGTKFTALPGTPKVNGLSGSLLTANPNEYNPQRLTHSQAWTCDQNHAYTPEQEAFDNGNMDKFVQDTGSSSTCNTTAPGEFAAPGLVMDYFDGNTSTALWNYAQHYSISDNNYGTNFGPSSPGAINLASGNDGAGYAVARTSALTAVNSGTTLSPSQAVADSAVSNSSGLGTIFGDIDPAYDECSDSGAATGNPVGVLTGKNIGDLLNAGNITWGWFQGGFAPTTKASGSTLAACASEHQNIGGEEVTDYVPHHDPFQFYASTANPDHLPPTSEAMIGKTDQANHQYDLSLFYDTLKDGNMPAVSFLKADAYQNGHPGNSDPLDEQSFIVKTVNAIEQSPDWDSTAIIITYDDSDGWYDHVASPVVNGSNAANDADSACKATPAVLTTNGVAYPDRCGYGPRIPLVVVSPYTRANYVSHNVTDQSSIINFVEDNWLGGQRIGNGSFDAIAGRLDGTGGVLDFRLPPHFGEYLLNPATGGLARR
jgi:phospholipase C